MKKNWFVSSVVLSFVCMIFTSFAYVSHEWDFSVFTPTHQIILEELQRNHDTIPLIPVVILGSGPAGLSASIFTARSNFRTVVFAGDETGGELSKANMIENWPGKEKTSGSALMEALIDQAETFDVELIEEEIERVDFSGWPLKMWTEENQEIHALAVIIATGGTQTKLDVPGVDKFWGHGIGICTICDAPFDKGKRVAVVGDNDIACDKALRLASFADHVTIIVEGDEMIATAKPQEYLEQLDNCTVLYNSTVEAVEGDAKVNGLRLCDASGNSFVLPIETVYFALGFEPNSSLVADYAQLTDKGYIALQETSQKTSVPGLFAAGNVEDQKYQKASVASGHGVQAALEAIDFLRSIGLDPNDALFKVVNTKTRAVCHSDRIEHIDDLDLLLHTIQNEELVVVDFFIQDCPACKRLSPLFCMATEQLYDDATFIKIDYDESETTIVEHYDIDRVPCILIFKHGELVECSYQQKWKKKELIDFIKSYIDS